MLGIFDNLFKVGTVRLALLVTGSWLPGLRSSRSRIALMRLVYNRAYECPSSFRAVRKQPFTFWYFVDDTY